MGVCGSGEITGEVQQQQGNASRAFTTGRYLVPIFSLVKVDMYIERNKRLTSTTGTWKEKYKP